MTEHLTGVRRIEGGIQANCAEHGAVGLRQTPTDYGWAAVATEARAHDDLMHDTYRPEGAWLVPVNENGSER